MCHTVLLRSDGQAVACGSNSHGQCNIPPTEAGISYIQVSGGGLHIVLLRSDGQAVACGQNFDGRCSIPPLDEGLSYSQVSAGRRHTVLLRSDGQAVACGSNSFGQCSIPRLHEGLSYSQVSAGDSHTVLLRSDGQAVACGLNSDGQCSLPPLDEGVSYSQVSAGCFHTVLLRSDGQAVACGWNPSGRCSIPPLDEGLSYSQVSAGVYHTVLLRSDGQAVACGSKEHGQCSIPPLDEGLSYCQIFAGEYHTVLLRSDGQAVACGKTAPGQCRIPSLSWGSCRYMAAPQNSRSGSTPKTHRRSRPPIQTCDPDRSRPHDPDLRSRPLASFCLGLLIQTPCFILEWTCWILPHPFPYGWTVALKDMLSSCLLRLACYNCLACSLLLAAAQLEHFGSRPATKIWSKSAYPVPDLVPRRSRPVPDRSRCFPDQFQGIELDGGRGQWPVQNHLILFRSYTHWLSSFNSLRSRRAEQTFYESGRSRRADHRGTFQTRLLMHSHINDFTTFPFLGKDRVVQVDFFLEGDAAVTLTCVGLDGLEVLRLKAQKSDRTVDVCSRVAHELNTNVENLRMVLPDARLLATICQANPLATLSDVMSVWAKVASILWASDGRKKCQNECGIPPPCHPIGLGCLGKFGWTCRVVEQCWLSPHHIIPT